MKIRCTKLINPNTGQEERSSPWRTIGKVYEVLEIYFGVEDAILKYRIKSDDNESPTLSHANLFEVVSDFIPSTWAVKSVPGKFFTIAPRAWHQADGFWVAYFDGEPWARDLYLEEVEKMLSEEQEYLKSLS
jgi:hypothetical protein